jgi:hypothetical protein
MNINLKRQSRTNGFARALCILLVIALFAVLLPGAASASPLATTTCKKTYEVKRGDTLNSIGSKTGIPAKDIVYFNGWKSPYTIYVGQRICLPTGKVSDAPKLENKYANAPAAHFTAGRSGKEILVYTFTYPKTTVLVKVDNAGDSVRKLINVGVISSVVNGKTYRFKLPAELQKASKLQICLKDRTTGYLQCVVPRSGP